MNWQPGRDLGAINQSLQSARYEHIFIVYLKIIYNYVFHIVGINCKVHRIDNLVNLRTSMKRHEIQWKALKAVCYCFDTFNDNALTTRLKLCNNANQYIADLYVQYYLVISPHVTAFHGTVEAFSSGALYFLFRMIPIMYLHPAVFFFNYY